jgi:NADH:ubiquinone oxidoreductase subunit 2 (subunit N)
VTLGNVQSLAWFWPETLLATGVLALLLIDLIAGPSPRRSAVLTLITLGAAAAVTLARLGHTWFLFGGLLTQDPFTDFFRLFFFATTAVTTLAAWRETADTAELFALLLTATLGMCLMAAAADLLLSFLGLETVSIASYLLAGFRRRSRASAEAALK